MPAQPIRQLGDPVTGSQQEVPVAAHGRTLGRTPDIFIAARAPKASRLTSEAAPVQFGSSSVLRPALLE